MTATDPTNIPDPGAPQGSGDRPTADHGSAGFCTNHAQAPDERVETVARVLHALPVTMDDISMPQGDGTHRIITKAARRIAAAVVAALDDAIVPATDDAACPRCGCPTACPEGVVDALTADLTAARAALDRVRALVAPKWRSIPTDLPDATAEAYSRGRNDTIDAVRAASDPEEPR